MHVDAYRLPTARDLDDLDLDYAGSIVVVEWGAGKLDGVADSWIDVAISRDRADDAREVTVTGHGAALVRASTPPSPQPAAG